MRYPSLYTPEVLRRSAFNKPLHVFLCGPGYGMAGHEFRENIRSYLKGFPNVRVTYGEEIDSKKYAIPKQGDLQSMEVQFAHCVDFTVLILESPGSIAELGTFSMIPNIRPRLFVMVPSRFYESHSYISRGPLSLIAGEHLNNIIYFDERHPQKAIRSLQMPLTLFKYGRAVSARLEYESWYGFLAKKRAPRHYVDAFEPVKIRFLNTITFSAILILEPATFPEIVALTNLNPDDVNSAIGRLFKSKSLRKVAGNYVTTNGFDDACLSMLNSTYLSRLKANFKAVA